MYTRNFLINKHIWKTGTVALENFARKYHYFLISSQCEWVRMLRLAIRYNLLQKLNLILLQYMYFVDKVMSIWNWTMALTDIDFGWEPRALAPARISKVWYYLEVSVTVLKFHVDKTVIENTRRYMIKNPISYPVRSVDFFRSLFFFCVGSCVKC